MSADKGCRYSTMIPTSPDHNHSTCLSAVVSLQWCAAERAPRQYNWNGYKQLFEMVRGVGLKLQVVLSFHACGGNVGDLAQVPLPAWVLEVRGVYRLVWVTSKPWQ